MAHFMYRARTAEGQLTRGRLRAPSEDRAASLLRSHGLTPVDIQIVAKTSLLNRQIFGGGVGTKDLILLSRQMASMIRAGVTILNALKALQRQVSKPIFRSLLDEIIYDIEGGESLSAALQKHPETFSPFFLGVVRTGEASGRLSTTLSSLADHLERDYVFVRKVRSALVYPLFVLVVVVLLAAVMFVYVLPQLTALFSDAGVTLPLPTRILLALTLFFQKYWLVVIVAIVALVVLGRSYLRTAEGRYSLSSFILHLPVFKSLFQKLYLARLTSVMHTLFESEVPILQSLQLARDAVGNKVYQRIVDETITAVRDGATISSVWEQEVFIPPLLSTMVGVGEKSGEIAKAFAEASRFFERDVNAILDTLTVLLEPILIIIIGAGVGIVVSAVLLPIYNLVLVI